MKLDPPKERVRPIFWEKYWRNKNWLNFIRKPEKPKLSIQLKRSFFEKLITFMTVCLRPSSSSWEGDLQLELMTQTVFQFLKFPLTLKIQERPHSRKRHTPDYLCPQRNGKKSFETFSSNDCHVVIKYFSPLLMMVKLFEVESRVSYSLGL